MKVELGGFGFSRPDVVQPAEKSVVSRALGQAGATIADAEQAAQRNREAFQRARAANSFAKYQLKLEDVGRAVDEDMETGAVAWDKADEEFGKRASKVKTPDDVLDSAVDRENFQGAASQARERTRQSLAPSIFRNRQRAGVTQLKEFLRIQARRAAEPGADAAQITASAAGFSANAREYGVPDAMIAEEMQNFWQDSAAAVAKVDPAKSLANLATANSGDPRFDNLTADQRLRVMAFAKDELASQTAKRVVDLYRTDARAGTKALVELSKSGLDPEVLDTARARVREGLGLMHAERREQFGEQATALERSISQDNPGANAEVQAASLYRRGAYSAEQYTNVLQAIDESRIRGAKKHADIALVRDAIANGKLLDPRDEKVVKAVDSWFIDNAATNGIAPGTDEWVNGAAAIAARTNVLPPEAMSWARKNLLSGDPAMSVPAANAIARFSDAAPAAYAFWDDPLLKANAEHVDGMVRAGVPPAKAVELARSITFDIPKARQDALQADYGKQKYAADNAGELKSFMDSDDNFDRTVFGGSPAPSIGMQDEFNAQVRRYFDYTNGDINRARNLAWQDLRGTYGVSTVNGAPQVLKYAPELIFPGIDPTVIRHDIDAAAASRNIKTPVMLTPSRATGDTHGVLWNLTTVDEDGNAELLLDDKNRPLQYAIPTDTQTYLEAADNAKRAAVEGARAESKKRREIAESMADLGSFPGY